MKILIVVEMMGLRVKFCYGVGLWVIWGIVTNSMNLGGYYFFTILKENCCNVVRYFYKKKIL